MKLRQFVLLSLLTMVVLILIGTVSAKMPRPHGSVQESEEVIAFATNRDGNFEIYVLNPRSLAMWNVTQHGADDMTPSWRSDGLLAWASTRDGNWEIYTGDTFGRTTPRRLTFDPAIDYDPTWSPDGQRIAFSSDRSGNMDIWAMDSDGTGLVQLTVAPSQQRQPAWSPDGQKIAYTSDEDGNNNIYIMEPDGSNKTRLTNLPSQEQFPSWSPDSQWVIFTTDLDVEYDLWAIHVTHQTLLPVTSDVAIDAEASWSPDGKQIVFRSTRDSNTDLYLLNFDGTGLGTGLRRLTSHAADDIQPAWSKGPIMAPEPTDTPIPTPRPSPTLTPTPAPAGDPYEPDDTCAMAQTIVPDGDPQAHTFHTAGDADWLRFQAAADTDYIVSALQAGPNAHPIIRLYDGCDKDPFADSSDIFGYDQIITFRAERDGLYYLKLTHRDPNAYGDDTAYQVSVRPATTGAAIIAAGRLYPNDDLQPQITFMSNRAYQVFRQAGYADDDIFYMSADPAQPPDMDAPSLAANLRYALQTWAPQRVADGEPLYLYLTNHGENEFFFLDTGAHKVTPDDLDEWLLAFEAQRPHSPVVVIIEACRSGSFITPLGTISKPGRVIITASGENTDAYVKPPGQGGGYFSDAFFSALAQNYDLWQSYRIARQAVQDRARDMRFVQTPWIDGNGNGLPYPRDPDDEGAGRSLGLGRIAGLAGQAPFIERPTLPPLDEDNVVLIQVKVLDENPEGMTVWMEVTKPSTPPPSPPPGYITPVSHAERVDLAYNPASGRFEVDFTFDETGTYQFVFNAEDAGGQRAQPVTVYRTTAYLPLVSR